LKYTFRFFFMDKKLEILLGEDWQQVSVVFIDWDDGG
jgi:hypothetical protein